MPGLVLIGLIAWGLIAGTAAAIDYVKGLQSDLAVAFVTAAAAVAASAVSLAIGKAYETKAAIRSDLRAKKTPVYEKIVGTLYQVVFAGIIGQKQMPEKELLKFFAATTERLSIWGSDAVLLAWTKFKMSSTSGHEMIWGFEDLVLAIRKDLGHQGRNMGRGSILRMFVNDLDQIPAAPAQQDAAADDRPQAVDRG